MGVVAQIRDGLQSIVANLATARDKAASVSYVEPVLDDEQIINAYRGSWLARNIIDIPADDSCREWREWKADKAQIELIEKEEQRLDVKGKVREARKLARLWGGAAIYISVKGQDPAEPFEPETVKKAAIDQLTVFTRHDLVVTEIETDPMSEFFGKPKGYMLANVTGSFMNTVIHPSRLAIFYGNAVPVRGNAAPLNRYWGDSVLLAVMSAVKHAEGTAANIASLIFEAKIDVISVENLMARANDAQFMRTIEERFSLAARAKGNNGTLILDKGEDYQQKTVSFTTLPDVLNAFMQIVSGASRIPATLLIGQAPQGMNATGIGDYRNYMDRVKAEQDLEMSPAMKRLDEALVFSSLGSRPPEVWYDWAPIWTEPPKDRADTFKVMADAARALAGGNGQQPIVPVEALSDAMVNALVESGILPGLEAAIEEYGKLSEQEPSQEEVAAAFPAESKQVANDARLEDRSKRRHREGHGHSRHNGFDPNQPRAGNGRWRETGAEANKGGEYKHLERADVYKTLTHAEDVGGSAKVKEVATNIIKERPDLAESVTKNAGDLGIRIEVPNASIAKAAAVQGEAKQATKAPVTAPKPGEDMSPEQAQHFYDEREVPDGWYVHGRSVQGAGKDDPLDTGYVLQMTRDVDTADQYAGSDGSVWFVSPRKGAEVLDLTDVDGADMGRIKKAFARGYDNGTLPASLDDAANRTGVEDVDEVWDSLKSSFSPSDIVNSAEAYDDPSIVSWVYEEVGAEFIHVPDGALALNIAKIGRGAPTTRDAEPVSPIVFAKVPKRGKRSV